MQIQRPGNVWVLALALLLSCDSRSGSRPAPPRPQGAIGRVTALQGQVSWSAGASGARKALAIGDEVRAEWTLHTGAESQVTLLLRNGHTWSLGESAAKLASEIQALSLEPVKAGALDRLADRGGPMEVDRTGAAGIQQERSAAGKAVSTRLPESEQPSGMEGKDPPPPMEEPRPGDAAGSMTSGASGRVTSLPPRDKHMGSGGSGSSGGSLTDLLMTASMSDGAAEDSGDASLPEKLSAAAIRSGVNGILGAARSCFARFRVAGTCTIQVVVSGSTGRVSSVKVTGELKGTPTARCVEQAFSRAVFGKFRASSQSFVFPLIFR